MALVIVSYLVISNLNRVKAQKIQNTFELYREVEIGGLVLERPNDWILLELRKANSRFRMVYGLVPLLRKPLGSGDKNSIITENSNHITFVDVKSGDRLIIFNVSKAKKQLLRDATQAHQVGNSTFFSEDGEADSAPACMKNYQGFYSFDISEKLKEGTKWAALFYIDEYQLAGFVTNPKNLCDFISERNIKQIDADDFDVTS